MGNFKLEDYGLIVLALLALYVLVGAILNPHPTNEVTLPPTEALRVGVLAFSDSTPYSQFINSGQPDLGELVRPYVEDKLTNSQGVEVYTRSKLDAIIQEQIRGAKGLIDPATAVQIGKLTGVQSIITGDFMGFTDQTQQTTKYENVGTSQNPQYAYVAYVDRYVALEVQFQIIDAETGRIKIADTLKRSITNEVKQGSALPDLGEVVRSLVGDLAGQIASKVEAKLTRSFSYGLYKDIEPNGTAIKGIGPGVTFTAQEQVVLLVYFNRMSIGDELKVDWFDPSNQRVDTFSYKYAEPAWAFHILSVAQKQVGNWKLEGYVNNQHVFTFFFGIKPEPEKKSK